MRQAASQARQRLDCGDLSPLLSTERKPSRQGFDRAASKSASKLARDTGRVESPAFGDDSSLNQIPPQHSEHSEALRERFIGATNCDRLIRFPSWPEAG